MIFEEFAKDGRGKRKKKAVSDPGTTGYFQYENGFFSGLTQSLLFTGPMVEDVDKGILAGNSYDRLRSKKTVAKESRAFVTA